VPICGSETLGGLRAFRELLAADSLAAALNVEGVRRKFSELGLELVASTPEQFAARQREEYARWQKVIEVGKISAD
jgi:tripartite-type tricarboxylate transporter receptor subunit TctC